MTAFNERGSKTSIGKYNVCVSSFRIRSMTGSKLYLISYWFHFFFRASISSQKCVPILSRWCISNISIPPVAEQAGELNDFEISYRVNGQQREINKTDVSVGTTADVDGYISHGIQNLQPTTEYKFLVFSDFYKLPYLLKDVRN